MLNQLVLFLILCMTSLPTIATNKSRSYQYKHARNYFYSLFRIYITFYFNIEISYKTGFLCETHTIATARIWLILLKKRSEMNKYNMQISGYLNK